MIPFNSNLVWMIVGTFCALLAGTVIRWFALRKADPATAEQRMGSLKVWWVLAALWSVAALLGKPAATLLLAVASWMALREFLRLLRPRPIGWPTVACLAMCGAVHYLLIVFGGGLAGKLLFPIASLILIATTASCSSPTRGYSTSTAGVFWGGMLLIYGLSHSLFLFDVGQGVVPAVGNAGWFLFLILLTEINDIMQAIVGRKFGNVKITPEVSPHKTLEGLTGGIASTIACSLLLAPLLTTFFDGRNLVNGVILCVIAGLLISIAGFFGDINMSAIKRDAGVKDGSNLFPGMGGVIDRIDSMTFTGPVFYYFLVLILPAKFLTPVA